MVQVPYAAAARVREIVALLDPDSPAPEEVHAVVRRLAAGTALESWFDDRRPTGRELMVICGQLAAARPGAGLAEALANLAEDCRSDENTSCPDGVVSVYTALVAAVPKYGPAPRVREYVREPDLFFPGVQEVSALAAAAAGLVELGVWDESDLSAY
jgi:hypothetical protein